MHCHNTNNNNCILLVQDISLASFVLIILSISLFNYKNVFPFLFLVKNSFIPIQYKAFLISNKLILMLKCLQNQENSKGF